MLEINSFILDWRSMAKIQGPKEKGHSGSLDTEHGKGHVQGHVPIIVK